jgi:NitT/TauT family transport system permease protein
VLDAWWLPYYALRTVLRMFAALFASTVFTLVVATLAARSRHAGQLIVPALDILQSVPILGFLTFTVTFFMGLFPGSVAGVEAASIFVIFTSQAWNMAFSFYQSLRSIPSDLEEATMIYKLSPIRRFLALDLPFGTPALVWNAMMSMSGGWFFVVASEAITVGNTTVTLPGIGSYLAIAIDKQNFYAVAQAVGAMALVIVAYDQLFFRPIVAWADRFRFEMVASTERPTSWVFDVLRRTRLLPVVLAPLGAIGRLLLAFEPRTTRRRVVGESRVHPSVEFVWQIVVGAAVLWAMFMIGRYVMRYLVWHDVLTATLLDCQRDLGADRGVDRAAPGLGRTAAADCAVSGGISRQCAVSLCGDRDRAVESGARYLVVAADDPGYPMVHPVQRDCRGQCDSDRSA